MPTPKSCLHIEACKTNVSELHNSREKKLDYVRPDLTSQNVMVVSESIHDAFQRIKTAYTNTVGQKMQAKATPIMEGTANLDPKVSNEVLMERLNDLSQKLYDKFGIKTIQTYIHRDEGHYDNNKEWIPNCHAHMVFDWTKDNGKSLRINKLQTSQIQTIAAECLHMERGSSSDVEHLNAIQYKVQKEQERLIELVQSVQEKNDQSLELSRDILKATNELSNLNNEKDKSDAKVNELAQDRVNLESELNKLQKQKEKLSTEIDPKKKTFLQKVESAATNLAEKGLSALSASEKDTLIKSLTMEVDEKEEDIKALNLQIDYAVQEATSSLKAEVSDLKKDLKDKTNTHDAYLKKTKEDIKNLQSNINALNEENKSLKSLLPTLHQALFKAGFFVKQVVDLVAGKASTLLKEQKITINEDSYTAHGGEKAKLNSYTAKDGTPKKSLEIDGKSFREAIQQQAELNKRKPLDFSEGHERKKGKGI